jgi:glycerol kinase
MLFDQNGQVVAVQQREHEQIYPRPGWVERWLKAVTRTFDWVEA